MKDLLSVIDRMAGKYSMTVRYLVSGGTSFTTNILGLYFFKEYTSIGLSASVIVSFLVAFMVSFLMMKYITFQDDSSEKNHRQDASYFGVAMFNLALNYFLVLVFVNFFGIWYILAQVIASLLIAISSFFIYKNIIFVKPFGSNYDVSTDKKL